MKIELHLRARSFQAIALKNETNVVARLGIGHMITVQANRLPLDPTL
jgi:hypothetical protein